MNKVAKKQNIAKEKKGSMVNEKALLLPLLFFTTVYLFCIRAKVVDTSYYGTFWYASEQLTGDLYGYFRMQLFVGITILFSIYMLFWSSYPMRLRNIKILLFWGQTADMKEH